MMEFFTIGINHKKAPVDLREHFALSPFVSAKIVKEFKEKSLIDEGFYLTTCNRSELYGVAGKKLNDFKNLNERLFKGASHLTYLKKGEEAISHLFCVAASLDAMVVGEAQILGQIKEAYFNAYKMGFTGPFINRTMLRAINVAKKVRSQTDIAKGAISVASVAVNLAKRCLKELSSSIVLVVGAGEMGALVVKQLKREGVEKILVVNRSWEKACLIAAHARGEAYTWDQMPLAILKADIVISSTGSPVPIIDKQIMNLVLKNRRSKSPPLLMIDLGIPRDVDCDVGEFKEVSLFNIDDLQNIAQKNNNYRSHAARDAKKIISREVERYINEVSHPESLKAIAMLDQKFEAIRREELEKTLSQLPELTLDQKEIISQGTKAVISKILNHPIKEIKDYEKSCWERGLLSDMILDLFDLNKTPKLF